MNYSRNDYNGLRKRSNVNIRAFSRGVCAEQRFDCFIFWNSRYAGRLKVKKRDMVVESEFHHKEKVVTVQTRMNTEEICYDLILSSLLLVFVSMY